MIKNKSLFIRKIHRYLGLFIGIQFLGWTISGLYFSWNDIDKVHGDYLRKSPAFLSANVATISPTEAIKKLEQTQTVDSLHSVHLIRVLGKPVYQIAYFSGHVGKGMHQHIHYALADAATGERKKSLTKEEGIAVAKEQVVQGAEVSEVLYLQQTDGHHEYREKPLPAWAVSFKNPDCTVYVSAELGTFQSIRHDQWRAFDFLWMFHTMDYAGRDNFNNWLLKILSVLGLFTVMSGFTLYIISSRTLKKLIN
ncbi:MAG: PepSY domain-containing protein [Cyclobacteriaceae bacterium]|jgi:uncharacterized iron-regulated membrane protein|nr:PepSY domain-containing protein [Cyclobacteriaceae bacterium]